MSKLLITAGVVLIVLGLIWRFIGRLPGDIQFKTGNVTFYFPIVTSILISIILTLFFYLVGRFK
ncbi:DUF2905 domain-containing protein [Oceanobacillus alkalisoli]|uniref:DUF2905 domain-containing protein n=1 Tax=Oceanobacillus alkalisoli TaxID=2925113 RepID=UPI001EF0A54B|nr:DUF2905 domain-containing protein [Oceanobacillus alkalisoli]MCF3941872.1 DUF2905 domain-containing protein [Oceanobacillus alkalisoli]MCG5104247.1 DUF2905 domain-containing protein [Oceanobacillus alkalisoli]